MPFVILKTLEVCRMNFKHTKQRTLKYDRMRFKLTRGLILGRGFVPVPSSFAVKCLVLGVRELKIQSLGFGLRELKIKTRTENAL